jgi:hypothetical protein
MKNMKQQNPNSVEKWPKVEGHNCKYLDNTKTKNVQQTWAPKKFNYKGNRIRKINQNTPQPPMHCKKWKYKGKS